MRYKGVWVGVLGLLLLMCSQSNLDSDRQSRESGAAQSEHF